MANNLCPVCFVVPPTTLPQARVEKLMELAREGAADPRVREVASALQGLLAERLGRAPTTAETVQWFADAIHLLVDYEPDPDGEEVFQPVQWTLGGGCGRSTSPITGRTKGCGDCEDLAALLVSLCMVANIPARVVWMEQPGAPLNHVSAQVRLGADATEWVWIDATLPGARVGEYPYAALARLGAEFRTRVFGVEDSAAFRPAGILPGLGAIMVNTPRLVIVGMPHGGGVAIGGTPASGGRWQDAEMTRWEVQVPQGLGGVVQEVKVTDAAGAARFAEVQLPRVGSADVDYATLTPAPRGSVLGVMQRRLVIVGMPRGGSVALGNLAVLNGEWLDPEMTRWAVAVPQDLAGTRQTVTVSDAERRSRSGSVTLPMTGDLQVQYGAMRADGAADLDTAGAVVVIVGMPRGGSVVIGGMPPAAQTWQDAEMTRWAVTAPPSMADGRRVVRVTDATGRVRESTVDVPLRGAVEVQYSAMRPVGGLQLTETLTPDEFLTNREAPSQAVLVVNGMPHGGSVVIAEQPMTVARWADAGMTRWAVAVPPSLAGQTQVVKVLSQEGSRSANVVIPTEGAVEVRYAAMRAAPVDRTMPTLEAPLEPPTLVIDGMPHFGAVALDGVVLGGGTWLPGGQTKWSSPVPTGGAGPGRLVTVSDAQGATRSARVTIAPHGPTTVQYATMVSPEARAPQGRVVVRGAPAGAEPRVVRLVDGAPTNARYLEPDPAGYLAVTLPVGSYHLELGTQRVPVTVALDMDSVYDVVDGALVFRASVTDARAEPRPLAVVGLAVVEVTDVPKTDATPGAANLDATVWELQAFLTNRDMPTEGVRGPGSPPPAREAVARGTLQPDGTTIRMELRPGEYVLELRRIGRPRSRSDEGVLERRSTLQDLSAGRVTIPFSEFRADAAPTTTAQRSVRVTGVPQGTHVSITGNVTNGPVLCSSASDACMAPVGAGASDVTITATLPEGLQVSRRVSPRPDGETTVDLAFDVRRALHMRHEREGVVGTDGKGLRRGYWSDATWNALGDRLPDIMRRVVKEFDRVGDGPDANGPAYYALFVKGHGMTLAYGTQQQVDRLKRDVAMVSTGQMNPEGHFPFEIQRAS